MLILSAPDVSSVISHLSPQELVDLIAVVFYKVYHHQGVVIPHRLSINSAKFNALFMPSRIDGYFTAIKVVSLPISSKGSGLPASTLVLDEATGAVRALINATSLTALRNAAGSLLATRLVGPSNPTNLLAFGAGKQIEAHVKLFLQSYPSLMKCTIINRSRNSRLANLERILRDYFPAIEFNFEDSDSVSGRIQNIVHSADIICTATSSDRPLFKSDWVKDNTHLNLVGSYTKNMIEIEDSLVRRTKRVLVDSLEACLLEAGDLINAEVPPEEMVEIGQLVHEDCTPVQEETDRVKDAGSVTIFKSVGIGLQDVAIAGAVLEKAISLRIGTEIENY